MRCVLFDGGKIDRFLLLEFVHWSVDISIFGLLELIFDIKKVFGVTGLFSLFSRKSLIANFSYECLVC